MEENTQSKTVFNNHIEEKESGCQLKEGLFYDKSESGHLWRQLRRTIIDLVFGFLDRSRNYQVKE